MTTPFSNSITGRGGALVRQSIHSPDYVPGVSGWTINRDGSSEFNNGVFRGSVDIGGAPLSPGVVISGTLPTGLQSYLVPAFLQSLSTFSITMYPGSTVGLYYFQVVGKTASGDYNYMAGWASDIGGPELTLTFGTGALASAIWPGGSGRLNLVGHVVVEGDLDVGDSVASPGTGILTTGIFNEVKSWTGSITPVASGAVWKKTQAITWNQGTMQGAITSVRAVATAHTGSPENVFVSVAAVTATGCNVTLTRTDAGTATTIDVIAQGVY